MSANQEVLMWQNSKGCLRQEEWCSTQAASTYTARHLAQLKEEGSSLPSKASAVNGVPANHEALMGRCVC